MLKLPSFDMNTRPETFVLLVHCVIDDTLSQATSAFVRRCISSSTSWPWWVSQMHVCASIRAKEEHFDI